MAECFLNHSLFLQSCEFSEPDPQTAIHLGIMLAQAGSRSAQAPRRKRHFEGRTGEEHGTCSRNLLGYEELTLLEMARGHNLSKVLHGKNRQMKGLAVPVDLVAIMLCKPSL